MQNTAHSEAIKDLLIIKNKYLLKILIFLLFCLFSSWSAIYIVKTFNNYGYFFSIPFYILAGASLHGICLFTHEGVHGTLHNIKWVNNLIGSLTGYLVLQSMAGYRVLHLKHHRHLNRKGDPGLLNTYVSNKYIIMIMEWGYLLFGYIAFLSIIPYQGFKQGNKKDKKLIIKDLIFIVLFIWFITSVMPFSWLLHGWLIPMVFVHFMMNIRGMSQHLMLEDYNDPYKGARTIKTNSIVDFFLCNENYHIEHHLYPNVPWYNLKKVHKIIKNDLKEKKSTVVLSFRFFLKQFIKKSIKSILV